VCKIKKCNNFEEFEELISESKNSCKNIFFNKNRYDKRKSISDFDDVFDNNILVNYYYDSNNLYILF